MIHLVGSSGPVVAQGANSEADSEDQSDGFKAFGEKLSDPSNT